jgi:hypothetical protein
MSIADSEMFSGVVERDTDLAFVQLLQTAPAFPQWVLDQLSEELTAAEFLGVRHSEERDTGESDIEFGIRSSAGESHIILIENKIDASFQDRQPERYFERGADYVDDEGWDGYSVMLIAPDSYVGEGEHTKFGNVLSYEDIITWLEDSDHDGVPFFSRLFEEATTKRVSRIDSYWTDEVARRLRATLEDLPSVAIIQASNKQIRIESTHPDHPHHVLYNVYFPGSFDGEKAVVRLNLVHRDPGISEAEFEVLKPTLFNHHQELELGDFDTEDRPMDPVKAVHWRHDYGTDDAYLSAIMASLVDLIEVYHSALVGQRTRGSIKYADGRTESFTANHVATTGDRSEESETSGSTGRYWVLYGVETDDITHVPEGAVSISVPDTFTGNALGDLPVMLVPMDGGATVTYD